jgi:hypothetical protein
MYRPQTARPRNLGSICIRNKKFFFSEKSRAAQNPTQSSGPWIQGFSTPEWSGWVVKLTAPCHLIGVERFLHSPNIPSCGYTGTTLGITVLGLITLDSTRMLQVMLLVSMHIFTGYVARQYAHWPCPSLLYLSEIQRFSHDRFLITAPVFSHLGRS